MPSDERTSIDAVLKAKDAEVFVVRIVRNEPHGEDWRGSINHVSSGHRRYLVNEGELLAFIRDRLKLPLSARRLRQRQP